MAVLKQYLPIGFIRKHTGLHGQVVVHLEEPYIPLLEKSEFIFYHDYGQKIPLFFEEFIELNEGFLIKFEGINDPETAANLNSKELFQDRTIIQELFPDILERISWNDKVDELLEYSIIDPQIGEAMQILAIRSYLHQDLAVIQIDGVERMVPLDPQLIDSIDDEKKIIFTNFPEGIFDI